MTKTILVPLDGSELGENALPWATRLAKELTLSLTLVRAVPWPEIPVAEFGGYMTPEIYDHVLEADRAAAAEYLARQQAELSKDGLSVATVLREGAAAETIHDVADELGAYAVVMASHGRGGFSRLVLGSVAERVLQQATIPVLLVRPVEPPRAASFHKVLVPLDGSPLAERAIGQALEILGQGSVLVLQRVVEPVYDAVGGGDLTTFVLDEDATAKLEEDSRAYLRRTAAGLTSCGVRVATRLHRGRPATEILRHVGETNPDAIVMTTHGRTGPSRWFMGSVADEVFRNVEQPVLLVSVRTAASRVTGGYSVRDLMTRDVEFVTEDEPVISVVRKLLRRRVSGAPVVDARGQLVGVVSEHDLLAWHTRAVEELSRDESSLDPAKYGERIGAETVGSVVTRPATAIVQDAELGSAVRMLMDRKIHRLPVTDGGRLVGIISRADIMRGMAQHWTTTTEPASTSGVAVNRQS